MNPATQRLSGIDPRGEPRPIILVDLQTNLGQTESFIHRSKSRPLPVSLKKSEKTIPKKS